jgi:isoquinoline 1-oxidoreductase alpha subunit
VGNAKITTIEGENGVQIAALKSAWLKRNVPQCGYCQVEELMSSSSLLSEKVSPDEEQINQAMSGNICRCGTYSRIKRGILTAVEQLATGIE